MDYNFWWDNGRGGGKIFQTGENPSNFIQVKIRGKGRKKGLETHVVGKSKGGAWGRVISRSTYHVKAAL